MYASRQAAKFDPPRNQFDSHLRLHDALRLLLLPVEYFIVEVQALWRDLRRLLHQSLQTLVQLSLFRFLFLDSQFLALSFDGCFGLRPLDMTKATRSALGKAYSFLCTQSAATLSALPRLLAVETWMTLHDFVLQGLVCVER